MRSKIWLASTGVIVASCIGIMLFVHYKTFAPVSNEPTKAAAAIVPEPLSRQVMLVAQQIVKDEKPAPTMAALQYAYVANVYNDALKADSSQGALYASHKMMVTLYPNQHDRIDSLFHELANRYQLAEPEDKQASVAALNVVAKYANRYSLDGHDLKWDGKIPGGTGKWAKLTAADPFTPRAGEWQRWNVSKPISVPPPPALGSTQDLQEIERVKQEAGGRSGEDTNKINFWGGTPGSETPSGIWQNQIFKTIKNDLPADPSQADVAYAQIQSYAAQTMSDAFMECWKVKYIYWTARPSMRIPGLVTAMKDPPFPSYISGHSTISKAVADVLSTITPKHAKQWEAMAVEARDSRLKAGIHFDIDNKTGFDVGTDVARQVINAQNLKSLLN